MKVRVENYQAKFDLKCPRCGCVNWSRQTYNSGAHIYRKCLDCGADVCAEKNKGGTDIVMVIENQYADVDLRKNKEPIKNMIAKELKESGQWKWPEGWLKQNSGGLQGAQTPPCLPEKRRVNRKMFQPFCTTPRCPIFSTCKLKFEKGDGKCWSRPAPFVPLKVPEPAEQLLGQDLRKYLREEEMMRKDAWEGGRD